MNKGNIFWGSTLLVLGILFLLDNLELLKIDVSDLITTYWPVMLIIAGISVLFKKKSSQ